MNFRSMLIRAAMALGVMVVLAIAAGWYFLPDDFEATEAWTILRRNNLELATQIKNVIVQSDQDVASIGEKRGLPLINIKMSRKDIAHFADLYERYEDPNFGTAYYAKHNLWRNAELTYGDRKYDVKIKSHGRSPTNHRSGKYISLAVKMPRGEAIQNSRRFSLLVRDHFVSKKQVVFDVAEHFGVMKNQEQLVRVKINNWDEKLFFFDRRLNDAYMEVEGRPSMRLFGFGLSDGATNKSSVYTGGPFDEQAFRERFQQTLIELEYPESQHQALTDRFAALNKAIYEQRFEDLAEFFDMDYVASFQAVRLVCALIGHIARVDNLYVFYNTANGKFYPVITRDSWMEKMAPILNGSPELFVDTAGPWEQPLFKMFSRNLDVRRGAYRKILDYIEEMGETIGPRHRALKERFDKLSYFGWANVGMRNAGLLKDDFTVHNLALIKHYIDTPSTKMKITVDSDKLIMSMAPESLAGVTIQYFAVPADRRIPPLEFPALVWGQMETDGQQEVIPVRRRLIRTAGGKIDLSAAVADFDFITPLTAQSLQSARVYSIVVQFESDAVRTKAGNVDLLLKNTMTGEQLKTFDAEAQFASFPANVVPQLPPTPASDSWLDGYPQLQTTSDSTSVTIKSGDYTLDRDLILPKHLKLIVEAGTTLRLAKDVVLCGYQGVDVLGTKERPVIITALNPDEPFGSVGILGDEHTVSNLNYVSVSGGRERWVHGVYFSGAMSLHYNGSVHLRNCSFAHNHADDGLNVKYGQVTISNCEFRDNAADQVDLDLCQGVVQDSQFLIDSRQDANGDGLDLSGSTLTVKNCLFQGFPDKGMSIGEQSKIECRGNRYLHNRTGVAVKDSSHAFLEGNQLRGNQIDVDAFQKKAIFSGGTVWMSETPNPDLTIFLGPKSKAFAASSLTSFAARINESKPGEVAEPSSDEWQPVAATTLHVPPWRLVEPVVELTVEEATP